MKREKVLAILSSHMSELRAMGVISVAVFGSVARNQAKARSDVDILVEFSKPVGLFEFVDVKNYLKNLLERRVDLVTPGGLRPQMKDEILREAVYAT